MGGGGPLGGYDMKSAGTAQIARESGGDSMSVDAASALEDTIDRIRRRYALHFHLAEGVKPGEERTIEVTLSASAQRRYPDAVVRYRRIYVSPSTDYNLGEERPVITRTPHRTPGVLAPKPAPEPDVAESTSSRSTSSDRGSEPRRRVAVSEPDGPRGVNPSVAANAQPQEPETPPTAASPAVPAAPPAAPAPQQGGWRVLKPGEKP